LARGKNFGELLDSPGAVKLIVGYSIAFFNHALLHQEMSLLDRPNESLASYRFQER